ncbi:DUF3019 domain-containing protein [Thalassotalea sp. ND16A]|uniref:DUF3019 domain-containing protein n=1 Tax=Thalassotalea sp. ND16A TaxID=1535422 RepID=UPI00051A7689|nr:DUF3019 domain-containing protein [Thalassotalea sp. ND16A]KGJ87855.1 hypothetical protein ND16A_2769 [Thalassotalea sp. ND16A]
MFKFSGRNSLITLLLLTLTLPTATVSKLSFAVESVEPMQIIPNKCVTTASECQMNIMVSWQVGTQGKFCLRVIDIDTRLMCDLPNEMFNLSIPINSPKNVKIELLRQGSLVVVSTAIVAIYKLKKKQRRRKVAWSIF